MGGATFEDEHHTSVINTRQYRAPEVITKNSWNQSSDLWGIGCIIIELYSGLYIKKNPLGNLFFQPKNNDQEHLAMIQKACGPLPEWMMDCTKNTQ